MSLSEKKNKKVYIIIGKPGSGKNTQAQLLSDYLKISHIDAGQTFVKHIDAKGKYATEIKKSFDNGEPIPSEIFFELMSDEYSKAHDGFVLTQNTKSSEEAEANLQIIEANGFTLAQVFYLDLSDELALQRLVKRLDGKFTVKEPNLEVLEYRLKNRSYFLPTIIEFYSNKGVLVNIDGSASIEKISESIREKLK